MSGTIAAIALTGYGIYSGGKASKDAARTIAGGEAASREEQSRQFDITRQDQLPWLRAATGQPVIDQAGYDAALATYQGQVSDFRDSGGLSGGIRGRDFGNRLSGGARLDNQLQPPNISDFTTYEGGALDELSNFGRSRVNQGDYIPESNIPQYDDYVTAQFDPNIDIYSDPSYKFRLGEMERQIDRGAAGMGKFMSGNRLEELMSRSGEMASQEYGNIWGRAMQDYDIQRGAQTNQYAAATGREADQYGRGVDAYGRAYGEEGDYINRLQSLSGVGQTTATNLGTQGGAYSANIGASLSAGANARAAGRIGQASAWQQGIGDITALATRFGTQSQPNVAPQPTPGGTYIGLPDYLRRPA